MKSLLTHIVSLLAVLQVLMTASCSTTRTLSEGEYRLAKNNIEVTNSKKFNTNSLHQYIKQSSNSYLLLGWNPFLYIYNWADPEDNGIWARFCRKIGVEPVIYNPEAVESTIESMKSHLEYMGYYNSKVTTDIKVNRKRVYVDYKVKLGKQYPIDSISISVPERGPFKSDFEEDRANISIKTGDFLSENSLEAETQRGAAHFRDKGYYSFSKNNYSFEADTISVPGKTFLEMRVNEYSRNESASNALPLRKFYIDSVSISYTDDVRIKPDILKDLNTLRPGDLYSESIVNNTYTRLSALRMFNSVGVDLYQSDTNKVNCSISLSQSQIQGFKTDLEVSSNSTGLMGISPQLSYYHKNIFHGGEWLNLSFMGNFQFKFNNTTRSNEFGVSAGLSFPRILGMPNHKVKGSNIPRTEVNASYNYQNRPEYTRNIISTSFGYSGTIWNRLSYQFYPLQLSIVHLDDINSSFLETLSNNPFMRYAYQDHFDTGLGGNFQYSSNQSENSSTSFSYLRLSADISGNALSLLKPLMNKDENGAGLIWGTPFSQYVRGELTLGSTWKFGKNSNQSIATRILGGIGYAYGNSSVVPFEKQFYSGGANSMRGWQARSLGPGTSQRNDSFIIPSQTGDIKFEANLEYRFNMFWKIEGALFLDAGNIWTFHQGEESSKFNIKTLGDSIAADWGTGIRVNLNFLVLRLDLGMKLHDPAREDKWLEPGDWLKKGGYALHFGVGYPF